MKDIEGLKPEDIKEPLKKLMKVFEEDFIKILAQQINEGGDKFYGNQYITSLLSSLTANIFKRYAFSLIELLHKGEPENKIAEYKIALIEKHTSKMEAFLLNVMYDDLNTKIEGCNMYKETL